MRKLIQSNELWTLLFYVIFVFVASSLSLVSAKPMDVPLVKGLFIPTYVAMCIHDFIAHHMGIDYWDTCLPIVGFMVFILVVCTFGSALLATGFYTNAVQIICSLLLFAWGILFYYITL